MERSAQRIARQKSGHTSAGLLWIPALYATDSKKAPPVPGLAGIDDCIIIPERRNVNNGSPAMLISTLGYVLGNYMATLVASALGL